MPTGALCVKQIWHCLKHTSSGTVPISACSSGVRMKLLLPRILVPFSSLRRRQRHSASVGGRGGELESDRSGAWSVVSSCQKEGASHSPGRGRRNAPSCEELAASPRPPEERGWDISATGARALLTASLSVPGLCEGRRGCARGVGRQSSLPSERAPPRGWGTLLLRPGAWLGMLVRAAVHFPGGVA